MGQRGLAMPVGQRYRVLGLRTGTDASLPVAAAEDVWVAQVQDTETGGVATGRGATQDDAVADAIWKIGGEG